MVGTGGVDPMLVADHLPELGTDLVTALTTLDMNDLTHLLRKRNRNVRFTRKKLGKRGKPSHTR
jgi:hypothetical protein